MTQRARIADIDIDLDLGTITTPEGKAELTPRVQQLLAVFLAHPDELLTRSQLFDQVWPGLVVEDSNLTQSVWMLRRAFGSRDLIRTVARKGYVFAPGTAIQWVGAVLPIKAATTAAEVTAALTPERVARELSACTTLHELGACVENHGALLGFLSVRLVLDRVGAQWIDLVPQTMATLQAHEASSLADSCALGEPITRPISDELQHVTLPGLDHDTARIGLIGLLRAGYAIQQPRHYAVATAMRANDLLRQLQLQRRVDDLGYAESMQRALFAIAEASARADLPEDFFAEVHRTVDELLDAPNLFIGIVGDNGRTLRFPYYVDAKDPNPVSRPYGGGLSERVIDTGQPLLADAALKRNLIGKEQISCIGTDCASWLGAPLIIKGRAVGLVAIQSYDEGQPYTLEDRDALEHIAVHIANALERRQVRDDLERVVAVRTAELRREVIERERGEKLQQALYRIADLASGGDKAALFYQRLHDIVADLMYARNFFIARYNIESHSLRMLYFVDSQDHDPRLLDRELPLEELRNSVTFAMIRLGTPLRGSAAELLSMLNLPEGNGAMAEHWLGAPMMDHGVVRGAVVVQSYEPDRRYSEEDQALLVFVAQHIWTALEKREAHLRLELSVAERTAALRQEITDRQRSERVQRALFEIADVALNSASMEHFYDAIHRIIGGLIDAKNFFVAMVDPQTREVSFPYCMDEIDVQLPKRAFGNGLTEYVYTNQKSLLAMRQDILTLAEQGIARFTGSVSACWLGVPLRVADRVVGVMAVQTYRESESYSVHDQELLEFVAFHLTNAMERRRGLAELERRVDERTSELADANRELMNQIAIRRRIELELRHETMHDPLTGMPNRNNLLGKLSQLLSHRERDGSVPFALMMIDLDRFKLVNDALGHLLADELLRLVAQRVSQSLRVQGFVARMGGDAFGLVVDHVESELMLRELADSVLARLSRPITFAAREWTITASIGIVVCGARHRTTDDLLREVDIALYRAKEAGRNVAVLSESTERIGLR